MLYIFIAFKSKVRNMFLPLARSFNLNQFSFLQFFFKEAIFYYFYQQGGMLVKDEKRGLYKRRERAFRSSFQKWSNVP